MKALLFIPSLLLLTSCGLQNQINDLRTRLNNDDDKISSIEQRLNSYIVSSQADLKSLSSSLGDSLNELSQALYMHETIDNNILSGLEGAVLNLNQSNESMSNSLKSLIGQLNDTKVDSQNMQSSINAITSEINSIQVQLNQSLASLAVLQGYKSIIDIKDPCGKQGLYNEVFLHLSNGTYLASFSDDSEGKNTRFSLLTDGNYMTTDGTNCKFTVSGNGTVISNEHN